MRIDKVYIKNYKNLNEFKINIDENEMKTVLLGQNATGKSNFIEALILIFKYLDLCDETKRLYPPFKYSIIYKIDGNIIDINYENDKYIVLINNEKIESYKAFFSKENKMKYQPKYVFTYYSGLSNKLKEHFGDHQRKFYTEIIKPNYEEKELDSLRKLFYVQLVHSFFVLLAFFLFDEDDKDTQKFLKNTLGIEDIESVLFILKKPNWAKNVDKKNNDIFWTAKGLVRTFLSELWNLAIAPIYHEENIKNDLGENIPQERLYLYIKDKTNLKKITKIYKNNTDFFKALESTYISDIIVEVRIKIKKVNVKDNITFKELSEGEQQLLTVLGLLKFTKEKDSLILLDEPDTHLNPIWKWQYLDLLEQIVKRPETTQIIINTHDPLVIGSLKKEQVRVFQKDSKEKIVVVEPETDPQGLGVAGILTSDLFGLPTTLDKKTQDLLNKRNLLLSKSHFDKITDEEEMELKEIFNKLNKDQGISSTYRDPLYQKFIQLVGKMKEFQIDYNTSQEIIKKQNEIALRIIEKLQTEGKL